MTLINPILSERKLAGLELMIPMMYHTWVLVTSKCLKSFLWWWWGCGRVIIVSGVSSLSEKESRERESLTIMKTWRTFDWTAFVASLHWCWMWISMDIELYLQQTVDQNFLVTGVCFDNFEARDWLTPTYSTFSLINSVFIVSVLMEKCKI